MALEEYRRKRKFDRTPEPGPDVEKHSGHRFVVQKHRASHLHYDFRLEMEGVLKSWAVPKGPSLDPKDKRLAMMVEDHPVSYFHFEGIIPPGNYGAGTVMVWDTGTWEPQGNAAEMLARGDLKFVLKGEKLKGSFVLARMRSRRPGSKGTEWLLIKHRDEHVAEGYNIDDYDYSVLTRRSLDEIAADENSAQWQSNRAAATGGKNAWLAKALAKSDRKKRTAEDADEPKKETTGKRTARRTTALTTAPTPAAGARGRGERAGLPKSKIKNQKSEMKSSVSRTAKELEKVKGAEPRPMPDIIRPMLATLVDEPFDDRDWLYEIKWDGYRALAFIEGDSVRLVSRNQNDLTGQYPELAELSTHVRARKAILDGEVVALDAEGRSSFSLMQQRTGGLGQRLRRGAGDQRVPIAYYAFDVLYLDGYDLRRVDLEKR
jgi:bifunctional non-homologous end joining protein LigD